MIDVDPARLRPFVRRLNDVAAYSLTACVGLAFGLILFDLAMAAVLMVRALKGAL